MNVIPILLVISMCRATVVPTTVRISKDQLTQLINSGECSTIHSDGISFSLITTESLPPAMPFSFFIDGLATYQDRNSPSLVHTKPSYSNERSTIKEAAGKELLFTSFATPTFIDFAEYTHHIIRRTDMVYPSRHIFVTTRMYPSETMLTSQQFIASFSEYNIDASHIDKTTSHELGHSLIHLSPTLSKFAISHYKYRKAFDDDSKFSNMLNTDVTSSDSPVLRVYDNDSCTSNCTQKRERLVCFSGIPCFIPKTVKSLEFRDPNYSQLLIDHRQKFNKDSLFNNVTELKLDVSPDLVPVQRNQDLPQFLSLFRSLKKISFAGENRLKCISIDKKKFHSVKRLFVKVCSSLIIFSDMLYGKLLCFPKLKSIIIRLRSSRKCSHINGFHEYKILFSFQGLLNISPHLEYLHVDLTRKTSDLFPPVSEVMLTDSSIYDCNNSSLVKISFTLYAMWQDIIYIRCHCRCPLIVVDSKRNSKLLIEPKGIDINGVRRVSFLSRVSYYGKCQNKSKDLYFAEIEFTFGSKLRIDRNCRDGKLNMTFDSYNRNLTYVFWHIDRLEYSEFSFVKLNPLNLSKRNISYILFHEGYFGGVLRVRNVKLSFNRLGRMAKYQSLDFEKILYAFTKLRVIDLAGNDISELPEEIFSKSSYLKSIILRNNDLATLRMTHFTRLTKLKTLDLSYNNIKTTVTQLREINHFLSLRNWSMVINMSENVFECSCTNYSILFSKTIDNTTFVESSYCELQNGDPVQFINLEDHCERQKILKIQKYSMATTASVIAVALFALVTIWKIRKQKRLTDRFVRKVKHGLSKKEFLIFLSYSSKDGEMAHKQILPEIAKRVIERTGVDKEHICTGDTHFIPGFNIIQEAMRCIDLCSVVVFVMTKSFVLSPFCRMEVKEALDQAKPIILIIKGNIDKRKMPRIIKNIFNKYSRFHFIRGINGVRVLPSWDLLVSAIFDLAAMEEKDIQVLEQLNNEGEENVSQIEEIEMREVKGNLKEIYN